MKLYTEEQVKNFLKERTFLREDTIDAMCDKLIPIELPNNYEIDDKSNTIDIEGLSWEVRLARDFFKDGAKWVIEQIKQQGIGH